MHVTPDSRRDQTTRRSPRGVKRSRDVALHARLGALALVVALAACADDGATMSESPGTTSGAATSTSTAPTVASPSTTTVPPLVVARTFVESVGDSTEQAMSVVAPGAAVDVDGANKSGDLEAWLDWNAALGWRHIAVDCAETGEQIVCDYEYTNPWMEQMGIESGGGNAFTLQIEDGLITSILEMTDLGPFWPLWLDFTDWLDIEHPGAAERITKPNGDPVLEEEALTEWRALAQEFTERLALLKIGDAYLDALLSFDPTELELIAGYDPNIYEDLYLQAWLKALNNRLSDRSCNVSGGRLVCTIETADDLGDLLDVTYVDSFAISVSGERIVRNIWSSSTVPDGPLNAYQDWLRSEQPGLFNQSGVCSGFFQRGPTPEDCALVWLELAPAYLEATTDG